MSGAAWLIIAAGAIFFFAKPIGAALAGLAEAMRGAGGALGALGDFVAGVIEFGAEAFDSIAAIADVPLSFLRGAAGFVEDVGSYLYDTGGDVVDVLVFWD